MNGAGDEAPDTTTPAATEVHLHFPVEIVVVGHIPEEERQLIEARIWEKLDVAIA